MSNLPAKSDHPPTVIRASEAWGISPGSVEQFLLKTVVKATKEYKPDRADCINFLIVCMEYALNPFKKEIFCLVSSRGIAPYVSVDGWVALLNRRRDVAGIRFEFGPRTFPVGKKMLPESCTCFIKIKGCDEIEITEFMEECYAPDSYGKNQWTTKPIRAIRHKALIQCARVAAAISGIYDEEEAQIAVGSKPARVYTQASEDALIPPEEVPQLPAPTQDEVAQIDAPEQLPVENETTQDAQPMGGF